MWIESFLWAVSSIDWSVIKLVFVKFLKKKISLVPFKEFLRKQILSNSFRKYIFCAAFCKPPPNILKLQLHKCEIKFKTFIIHIYYSFEKFSENQIFNQQAGPANEEKFNAAMKNAIQINFIFTGPLQKE